MDRAAAPVPACKRNTRVLVQRLRQGAVVDLSGHVDESDDSNWEPATNIGTAGKIWAAISTPGSREFQRREQIAADVTHIANCAYLDAANITQKMRLIFRGRKVNVSAPPENVDENNHSLVFACIEIKEGS